MAYKVDKDSLERYFAKEPDGYILSPITLYKIVNGEIMAYSFPTDVTFDAATKIVDIVNDTAFIKAS